MTRSDFLATIVAGTVAVKAVAETGPESRPKRLLALEYEGAMNPDGLARLKAALKPYEERYNVEFLIFLGGLKLVDRQPTINVTIQGNVIGNEDFARSLANKIGEELRQQGAPV